jgi:ankyrin repeat protein
MEMQSVADNFSGARVARLRNGGTAGRAETAPRFGILACLAFIALPHGASAQDLSINARMLAAARAGDQAAVAQALSGGASANARNRIGETALVIALKSDRPALAMDMVNAGTDVNLAAVNGVTPLMAAAHAGQTDIVRLLLAKGANVAAVDRLQKSAMIYAAGQGRTDIVVLLLRAGVDPNAVYVHDLTALMWAAGYGKTETAQALVAAGARGELKDDRGKTALDIAREGNFAETVKLLEHQVRR